MWHWPATACQDRRYSGHARRTLCCDCIPLSGVPLRVTPDAAPVLKRRCDGYFNGSRRNLESMAVSRYRENHRVDLIPVDLPTPEEDFFSNNRDLHQRIERTCPDYCRLVDWHGQFVREYGFAYLNSEHCSNLFSKLDEVIVTAIDRLLDRSKLTELNKLWTRTEELRDRAMMKNIENHCRQGSFGRAAFLVGAAHRQSLIEISRSESGAASSTIKWDFAGFLEESHLTAAHNEQL